MKKKFLLFLLATVAGAGTLFAESGKCGENLTWNLTGGVLTISGTGEMYDFENGSLTPWYDISSTINTVIINEGVTYIGASAFEHCENIQAINIPYSITSIGDGAFNWCESLTQVTLNSDAIVSTDYTQYSISNIFGYQVEEYIIGNRVTSIGHRAFYNYDGIYYGKENNLTSVTIGNSVTSIGSEAFYGCSNLVSASLSEGVTSIGDEAFEGCSSLSSINIPESVTSIKQMAFFACTSLTSINIPEGITIIETAVFSGCSFASINIPQSVTIIAPQAFWGCSSLTSINIPNSVTYIGSEAFSECSSLASITIPGGITRIETQTFFNCSSLTSISIPEGVASIGEGAFDGCSSLTSIDIPESVKEIGFGAFAECENLTRVKLNSNAIASNDYTSSNTISSIFGYQVEEYIIGDSVTQIGDWTFYVCYNLVSVTIGNNVERIGENAFYHCNLKSVIIPHNVSYIGREAFYRNDSLQTLIINSPSIVERDEELLQWAFGLNVPEIIIGDGITKIGKSKFYGFGASFTIPNSVKSIGNEAFSHCGFKSIIIPNSVTEIGGEAFGWSDSLEYVTLPNNIKELYGVFNYCTNLKSIDIPNGVTSLAAFHGCTSLESVNIPNSVTYLGGFRECSSLTSIDIPESVKEIGGEAFSGCTNLKSVWIPNSVTHIHDAAFRGSGITSITIPTQIDSIGSGAFNQCDSLSSVIWKAKKAGIWEIDYYGRCVSSNTLFDECPMLSSLTVGEEVDSLPYFWGGYYFKSDSLKSVTWNAKHCEIRYHLPLNVQEITFGNKVEYIPTELCHMNHGIKQVIIPNSVKSIGNEAFACDSITKVIIGDGLTFAGHHAFQKFNGRISSITCYTKTPPQMGDDWGDEGLAFNTDTMFVPAESVNAYKNAYKWSQWNKLLPIGATPVETDDLHITPSENYADIIWKAIANAASYELYIEFMGNTWRFVFDAEGILTSMANHAPARYDAPQGTQSAGFSYTVMGLASGTTYNVTITAKAANGSTLNTETASFTTTGEPQGIEDVNVNNTLSKKIIRDGNVYILRGEKVFTLQGQEVK